MKILVVEDSRTWQEEWKTALSGKITVISAFTVEEADKQFAANQDVAAIIMDACVPGSRPTTLPLVQKFRETFRGPVIAASSSAEYRQQLLQAGCDHECPKDSVPEKLLAILGI